jgi:hypothetical protein
MQPPRYVERRVRSVPDGFVELDWNLADDEPSTPSCETIISGKKHAAATYLLRFGMEAFASIHRTAKVLAYHRPNSQRKVRA